MTKTDNHADVGKHVFERAGLGKAPFRFVGMRENMWSPAPGVEAKPGGSCAYCATGIRFEFVIRSADGREFTVGSECVRRTRDAGLIKAYKSTPEYRQREASRRQALAARKHEELASLLASEDVRQLLDTIPHPYGRPGESFLNYCEWMLDHAGDSGRARTLAWVRKDLAKREPKCA